MLALFLYENNKREHALSFIRYFFIPVALEAA